MHVYPLYENGLRAHRKQPVQQNSSESAKLYAQFAKVAEKNPFAWNYLQPAETADSIGTVTKKNRMISFPCKLLTLSMVIVLIRADLLLMNAFNNVNLAGACLLTSTKHARELGISESKWIFPLGGAGTSDCTDCMSIIPCS
jgi:hypothetical protein